MIHIAPCQVKFERLSDDDISKLIAESNKIQLRKRKGNSNYRLLDKDKEDKDFNYGGNDDDGEPEDVDQDDEGESGSKKRSRCYTKRKKNKKATNDTSKNEPLYCKLCHPYVEFAKSSHHKYYKHVSETHRNPEDGTYSCHKCPFITKKSPNCHSYQSVRNIMDHFTVFHEVGDYVCYVCSNDGLKYETTEKLINHIEKLHSSSVPDAEEDENPQLQYHCQICNLETYTNPLDLNYHTICHRSSSQRNPILPATFYNRKNQFKCKLCHVIKCSQTELNYHMDRHESIPNYLQEKPKPHACPICQRPFELRKSMLQHLNKHSATNPFTCKICVKNFASRYHLERHLVLHFPQENKIICPICDGRYSRTEHLNRHLKTYHTVRSDGERFKRVRKWLGKSRFMQMDPKSDLAPAQSEPPLPMDQLIPPKSEIIDPELVDEFRNQLTDAASTTKDMIQSLLPISTYKYHHNKDSQYKCTICPNVVYGRLFHLQVHNKKCHPQKVEAEEGSALESQVVSLTCGSCGFKCTSSEDLKVHLETHILDGKRFQCSRCPQRFQTEDKLDDHFTRIHMQTNPIEISQCPNCNKYFANSNLLSKHKSRSICSGIDLPRQTVSDDSEEEEESFKCSKCPRILHSKKTLLQHEKIHSPNRKFFQCQICEDKFATKCTLRRHVTGVHFKIKHIPVPSQPLELNGETNDIDRADPELITA